MPGKGRYDLPMYQRQMILYRSGTTRKCEKGSSSNNVESTCSTAARLCCFPAVDTACICASEPNNLPQKTAHGVPAKDSNFYVVAVPSKRLALLKRPLCLHSHISRVVGGGGVMCELSSQNLTPWLSNLGTALDLWTNTSLRRL
jgi:hypothetical protein